MKKALLLYNPKSGKGAIEKNIASIVEIFKECDYELIPTVINFNENPFEKQRDWDLVVVAGGDGTVNFAVNCMKSLSLDLKLGVIPAGTANDFAFAIGMSKDVLEAARQIASGEESAIDCGHVNNLYFVNIFSFGIFTTTSQRTPDERKHRIGKLAYLIEGVKEFWSMHGVPLKVKADGEEFSLNSLIVLVFNGESAGGFHLARRSSLKDGKFEVLMLEKKSILSSTLAMGRYLLGGNPKIVKRLHVHELFIESDIQEPTDVDGQKGAEFPLHIECLKGELRVVCPKDMISKNN